MHTHDKFKPLTHTFFGWLAIIPDVSGGPAHGCIQFSTFQVLLCAFFFLMICRSQGEEKSGELKGFEYKGVIPSLSFFPIRTHCYPLALSESVLHTAHTFPHPTLCLWGRRRLLGIRDSPFSLGEERSGCWKCTLRQHCGGGLNSRGIKRAQ